VSDIVEQLKLTKVHGWIIAATVLGFFFDSFDSGILAVALPTISKEWQIDSVVGGLIGSASLWGMGVGSIVLGTISDLYGRRLVMIITVLGIGVFTGLSAFAFNPESLWVFRFVTGLFIGAMIPVDLAYVAEISPLKFRGTLMAALGIMWPIGNVVASSAAALIVPDHGWRWLFLLGVIPAFVALWIRRQVPESPRWLAKRGRYAEALVVLRKLGASEASVEQIDTETDDSTPRHSLRNFRILFTREYGRRTIGTSLLFFLHQFQSYGWTVWVPTIISLVLGFDIKAAIGVTIVLYSGSVIGRLLLLATVNRIGRRAGLIGLYAIVALCAFSVPVLLGTPLSSQTWIFIAIMFVYHVATDYSPLQIWAPELFPTEIRGLGSSFAQAIGRIGGGLGPIFFGFLMSGGDTNWVFLTIAGTAILIILITTFVLKTETRARSLSKVGSA
jgi:putative MFS transporter